MKQKTGFQKQAFRPVLETGILFIHYRTVQKLHKETVARVCAPAQAAFVGRIMPHLTEEETAVYKRGRNAHVSNIPKNATASEYGKATGLEALFGWLYLKGQTERVEELFALGQEEDHAL